MRQGKVFTTAVLCLSVLLCLASASAQQVRFFPDFNPATSPTTSLQMNRAHLVTSGNSTVLQLTDGLPGAGAIHNDPGSAWFTIPQPLNAGFTVWFQFQIKNAGCVPNTNCSPGDGLAFVAQNATTGPASIGVSGGGLGYTGIANSVAIEFDTRQQAWDPTSNHVAVQGCGTAINSPIHTAGTFTVGGITGLTSCLVSNGISSNIPNLGVTCGSNSCADGTPHDAVVEYTPPTTVGGNGTLMVWVDPLYITGTHTPLKTQIPAINIPYNIDHQYNAKGITLAGGTSALVGFAASQSSNQVQAHDILAWEFTPHTPTQVTQVIQGCPPTNPNCQPPDTVFSFGGHVEKVTYFQGFVNNPTNPSDPFLMTVKATPTLRSDFYKYRILQQLPKPLFANEQCVVYLGTGGKCMVYSITCQLSSNPTVDVSCPSTADFGGTCNNVNDPGCITFGAYYYSADGVTARNADYLSTDPVGSNNWQSIFFQFLPNAVDSGTVGKKPSPSDFVATFCVGTACPLR